LNVEDGNLLSEVLVYIDDEIPPYLIDGLVKYY
jgi:hypothetical protein